MPLTTKESIFYEYILQSDIDAIHEYLFTSPLKLRDVLFSYHCLLQYQDEASLEVSSFLWKTYRFQLVSLENTSLLTEFDSLTWSHLGTQTSFYHYHQDEPDIQDFIKTHHHAIEHKIGELSQEIKKQVYQPAVIESTYQFIRELRQLLSSLKETELQLNLSDKKSLIPENKRTNDLYKLTPKELDDVCDRVKSQLILNAYDYVIKGEKSIEEASIIIRKSLQVFHLFMEKGKESQTHLYYPLLNTLAHDLSSVFYQNPSFKTNSIELWNNVASQSYPPKNISLFTKGTLPSSLIEFYPEETFVYRAIWIMLADNSIILAPDTLTNKDYSIYHIDLANGQPVLSAGVMIFSAQSDQLLAINNRSGHYNPSLDSILKHLSYFKQDKIENVVVGDYQWNYKEKIFFDSPLNSIKKMRKKSSTLSSHTSKMKLV